MNSPRIHPRYLTGFALVVLTTFLVLLGYFWSRSQSNLADKALSSNRTQVQVSTSTPLRSDLPSQARVSESYGKLPLSFEANNGQTDPAVKFISRGSGYSLFLTSTEAVLTLRNGERRVECEDFRSPGVLTRASHPSKRTDSVLRMKIVGANPDSEQKITGLEELPGRVNYFIGNDPKKWRTNVSTYAKIKYEKVYPGVNLVYYGNQRQLEYDFVLEPGADPNQIRLEFTGAEGIRIDETGDLVLTTKSGDVRQHKPVVYQEEGESRMEIVGSYVLTANREVGFEIGNYDMKRVLVIDPTLTYSTYLGGSQDDIGNDIAVDSSGNAYVTGRTVSLDFPTTAGAFQSVFVSSPYDVFVTKLNPAGSTFDYSTYLGGSNVDEGIDLVVDSSGSVYVTGNTRSANFPTTAGSLQPLFQGGLNLGDAFVAKINAAGNSLDWSTYLGGGDDDRGRGIGLDMLGNVYIAGHTWSSNFPILNQFQSYPGDGFSNGFFAKLNAAGSALAYSTYFGGNLSDVGESIAVDSSGKVYITGHTQSSNFPSVNAFQPALSSTFTDAFVMKIDPTLSGAASLVYSTYLGGSKEEAGNGITVNSAGNAYIVGSTASVNFPTKPGGFQAAYGGGIANDAFVAMLSVGGDALVCSTYLGGGAEDQGRDIAVDVAGNIYVTGLTHSSNFPIAMAYQSVNRGAPDAFIAKLNANGSTLVYSSYHGGSSNDIGQGIALDSSDNAYVVGYTFSSNYPTVNPAQSTRKGNFDTFVAKIGDQPFNQSPIAVCQNVTKLANSSCQVIVTPEEVNNGSSDPSGDSLTLSLSPSGPYPLGATTVTLTATDDNGISATCTATVTVIDNTPPTIIAPPAMTVNADVGLCSATALTLGTPSVGDNCAVTSTTNNAPSAFPLGETIITWTVTDSSGNTNTATQLVTVVNPNPVVTITGPTSGSIYAVGSSVNFTGTFTDAGGGMHSATWMFDAISQATTVVEPVGSMPGSSNTSYTFTTPGVYQVNLTVNDSCGGKGSANYTLIICEPPAISEPPVSQTVCAGAPVGFSMTATGSGLSYQWRKDGVAIGGATSSSYSIAAATAADVGSYDVIVTGSCGTVTSNAATLIVNAETAINAPPMNQTTCELGPATFAVTATGAGLSYQWRKNGIAIGGATTSSYSIPSVVAGDAGSYDVVVTGTCGIMTSNAATLTVDTAPAISTQPNPQTECVGSPASFSFTATGAGLTYQWRKNGNPIGGATSSTFSITSVAMDDAGSYDVVVSGTCSPPVISSGATLTVNPTTAISTQPVGQSKVVGQSASFSVAATGTGLSYQWRKDGMAIGGATASGYSISFVTPGDAGNYDVVVSGVCGDVTSDAATLTVDCPTISFTPATLSNGTVGLPYPPTNFSATGGNGAVTFSVTSGSLPPGMSLVSGQLAETPTQVGSFSFTITATDAYTCEVSQNYTLTINCPTIIVSPGTIPIAQINTAYPTQTFSATGGNAPYTISLSGTLPAGMSFSGGLLSGTPTAPGDFPLTVNVTDNYGCTESRNLTLQVNSPPVAVCQTIAVTSDATCSASADINNGSIDPDGDTLTITQSPAGPYAVGTHTVTLTVDDGRGGTSTCTATVTVNAPTPVPDIIGPTSGSLYQAGTPITFTGTFTDLASTTHTAIWEFEGTTPPTIMAAGSVVEPVGATPGSSSVTQIFTTPGVYLVTLTVANNCGGSGQATNIGVDQFSALVVIYDPNGGFVTGGGWINSPAGAYTAEPTLTGKANFGFVSKYQNGASVPTGNTEFQFKAGNLNFRSTAYEWLVVAGNKAQYKGSGTINGTGDYRFMLSVIDGQLPGGGGQDKFRIRIWSDGGGLVYDNMMNDPDNADPTTVLGGGSIVIHK